MRYFLGPLLHAVSGAFTYIFKIQFSVDQSSSTVNQTSNQTEIDESACDEAGADEEPTATSNDLKSVSKLTEIANSLKVGVVYRFLILLLCYFAFRSKNQFLYFMFVISERV